MSEIDDLKAVNARLLSALEEVSASGLIECNCWKDCEGTCVCSCIESAIEFYYAFPPPKEQ